MKSEAYITYLRISYWVGAVIDALVIISMLSPRVSRVMFEMSNFNPSNDYGYASGIGASLMAGMAS